MAVRNNFQSNPPVTRGQGSGFVVDLRALARQAEQKVAQKSQSTQNLISRESARLAEKLRVETRRLEKTARRLERKAKRIKPNLLREPMILNWHFWPGLRRLAATSFRPAARPVKKNNWPRFVREQARILDAPIRLAKLAGSSESTALQKARQRADQAEDKATWYRSIFSFAFVLLLLVVPIKLLSYFELLDLKGLENKVMDRSQLAINNLMAAADSVSQLDFKGADSNFQAAGANFLAAQEDLGQINDGLLALASLSNDPKMKLAAQSKKFLTAGAIAASLGQNLVLATDSLFNGLNGDKADFAATLDSFLNYGHRAVADAQALEKVLAKIDPVDLPAAYQDKFIALDEQAEMLVNNLAGFVSAGDKLKEVLGLSRDKRYLLVFQNNAEMRASGGFLGSYALVDLRAGKIRNLEVPGGGSYDTEAGMRNFRVVAPEPLWLVNPLWHFWDANWWPDWPTTAKNLMWFYEHSDGPSVDGVIGLTPTVVEGLLEITGPIDLSQEYGLVIDADNFWTTVQTVVEQKNLVQTNPEAVAGLRATSAPVTVSLPLQQGLAVNSDNKPKKIIGDLMAKILETLPAKLSKDNLLKIIMLFEKNMSEKQILFYFTDPDLQAEMVDRNFAGEMRTADRDYLMVVNTNIAGQKSDRLMEESISHDSQIAADGSIINTVTITRTHAGVKNEALTGVRNVDWLRVYVPGGSELLSASGFIAPDAEYFDEQPEPSWTRSPLLDNERAAKIDPISQTKIYAEQDKTVFANWVMVDPGETAVITLKYRLPFNFLETPRDDSWLARVNRWLNSAQADLVPYSLLVQKQPGAKASQFTSRLSLPVGFRIFWRHPDDLQGKNGWAISDQLNADKYWSVLLEK